MKMTRVLLGLVAFAIACGGLSGCQKEEAPAVKDVEDVVEVAPPAEVEDKIEEIAPAVQRPASDIPKDHPAH